MALDIKNEDGYVQVVISTEMLERFMQPYPGLALFPMPVQDGVDDLPTYGIMVKELPKEDDPSA